MSLPEEAICQKAQRLQQLKVRAQQVLAQADKDQSDGLIDTLETAKLLEDLRIYQVELELQNDELRDAQQDAELARKRYQTLFAQMPLASLVVDDRGGVDDCNTLADALLGPQNRFAHQDNRLWQLLNREDRKRLQKALRDMAPGQTEVLVNVGLGEPGPSSRVFDFHLMGLSIDYKLDRRVLLLLVDRTAEVARRKDQIFYSQLLDSSDSFIYAADPQGKFLLANQPLLDFFGQTREAVQHQPRDKFLPLRDAILHNEADQKVLQSGQALTLEEQVHMAPPRGRLDFLTRKFPLHDLDGRVYGVGGISTDITALKDQHRQTLLSEIVFMSATDAIIITDAETRIVRVNPAFTQQTGFSANGVLGRKTNILKSGRQDAPFYAAMWQALAEKGQWSGEINNRRLDGGHYTIWSTINVVREATGKVLYYIAVQTDLTQLQDAKLALAHQASHDDLTGLPNRMLFNDRMLQLVGLSNRHSKPFALLFVDLDRFKEVNDTLGHQVGDVLLCEVSRRLQEGVRLEDTVARIGGDEFVVLLPGTDGSGARAVADGLLARLREPVQLEGAASYRPMASIGLSVFPQDGDTPDLLLRNADIAMYVAKIDGRNRLAAYRPEMSVINGQAFAIQTDLAEAIEQGQLRVYFQPQCRLSDGALMGAEALVRWQRPGNELVFPGEFIGLAEKCGLLVALDRWVMNEALHQVGIWVAAGLWRAPWRLAVNQNVADLQRPDMLAELQAMLNTHGVSASALELEITEDTLLRHTPEQMVHLGKLRDLGVSVSIDDFGTGYSSLAYLRQMPVSVIKIDMSFVSGMLTNDNDAVLVRTIVDMAHNLGHTVVAEGIEHTDQLEHLSALGAELGQGYLFGRAVSAEDFTARWLDPLALNEHLAD